MPLADIIPAAIERYCIEHSAPEDPARQALADATRQETDLPQMMVGPLEGNLLRLLVRLTGARRILEIGTFTGYSALAMAEALPDEGELVTLDVVPESVEIATRFWQQTPHAGKIVSVLGDAHAKVQDVEGPFDLVFIDADKEGYATYWDAVLPKVRPGGLVVVDNVLWSGSVLAPDTADAKAISAFNDKARADPRVECVMLPVRDGMLLAWKRPD